MTEQPANRHIGRKIGYSLVIFLSGLVIVLCVVGVIGSWILRSTLTDLSTDVLTLVENSAGSIRQVAGRVDGLLAEGQQVTGNISQAADQLSQNVEDKGLVMVLLPEEQEQKLTATVQQVADTFATIQDLVATGLEIYRTVNSLPFVSLPTPDSEQIASLQDTIANVQSATAQLTGAIEDFRSGAAEKVDVVSTGADGLTDSMQQGRDKLATLDAQLAALQDKAAQLKETIPAWLLVAAIVLTLLLAYILYTQVEVIGLFVNRWKALG
jgi:BMFP domain-containing protein YqiC